jgi:hypothetical protein
MSSQALWNPA